MKSSIDVASDAVLDEGLRPCRGTHRQVDAARRIFLTGATGLVGVSLLRDLLNQTSAEIVCLTRADSMHAAHTRLQAEMQRHELWNEAWAPRITPVVGDLSAPLLGLSQAAFDDLADTIDVIYHAGALVNFMHPYATLRAPNVLGTREVLRLAGRRRLKSVHYVSSVSVFRVLASTVPEAVVEIHESDTPPEPQPFVQGYSQSKWAGETLVARAGQWGVPIAIYRPASIFGNSRSGVTSHVGSLLLKAWLAAGAVPRDLRPLNLVPADYVSGAIVQLSKRPESIGCAFHLVNPVKTSFRDVFDMLRAHGHPLEEMSNEDLRERLRAMMATSRDAELIMLYLTAAELEQQLRPRAARLHFRDDDTVAALAGSGITCPPINRAMLDTFYAHLSAAGLPAVCA